MNKRRAKRKARIARKRARIRATLEIVKRCYPMRTTFSEFADRLFPNIAASAFLTERHD